MISCTILMALMVVEKRAGAAIGSYARPSSCYGNRIFEMRGPEKIAFASRPRLGLFLCTYMFILFYYFYTYIYMYIYISHPFHIIFSPCLHYREIIYNFRPPPTLDT